jgi:hypothetical protein
VTCLRRRESRQPGRTVRSACRKRSRWLMVRSACPTVAQGAGWQFLWHCRLWPPRRVLGETLTASRKSASRRRTRAAWACPQVRTSEVRGSRMDLVANRYAHPPWFVSSSSPVSPPKVNRDPVVGQRRRDTFSEAAVVHRKATRGGLTSSPMPHRRRRPSRERIRHHPWALPPRSPNELTGSASRRSRPCALPRRAPLRRMIEREFGRRVRIERSRVRRTTRCSLARRPPCEGDGSKCALRQPPRVPQS